MGSFNVFDVSASGMSAQRMKLDTIASNVANINTTRKPDGTPGVYTKKEVTFQSVYLDQVQKPPFPNGAYEPLYSPNSNSMVLKGGTFFDEEYLARGVEVAHIRDSKDPYKMVYDPAHPDSDPDGYVMMPNINIVEEMVNMVSASKAYEANAVAAETAKSMITSALRI